MIAESSKKVILSKSLSHLYMSTVVCEIYQCQQGVFQDAGRCCQGAARVRCSPKDRQLEAEGSEVTKQAGIMEAGDQQACGITGAGTGVPGAGLK